MSSERQQPFDRNHEVRTYPLDFLPVLVGYTYESYEAQMEQDIVDPLKRTHENMLASRTNT